MNLSRHGWAGWGSLVLLLLTVLSLHAARPLGGLQLAPESGISMRLTNAYEDLPPCGYLPLRVEIRNGSSSDHAWDLRSSLARGPFRTSSFSARLSVPANSEKTFDLLLPLVSASGTPSFNYNLTVAVSGHGVVRGLASEYSSFSGRTPLPYLGMGESLSSKYWGILKKEAESDVTYSLEGTPLSVDFMPEDWKGLLCFSAIILSDSEWKGLSASQREAVLSWVSQGGHLVLTHESPAPLGLPVPAKYGAGSISVWAMGDDFVARSKEMLLGLIKTSLPEVLSSYTTLWPLAKELGVPSLPRAGLIVFVIAFALVVGPVNLIFIAPAGHRHRLFWSVPLISLSATVLLVLFIVLSEGLGGRGQRMTLEFYDGGQNRKVVWQDQAARTGMLVNSSFALPTTVAPFYLSLQDATTRTPQLRNGSFFFEDGKWGGDWFRSRALQGQALIAIAPSRERLEVSQDSSGVPSAISSFADELQDVWYFGKEGAVWHAASLQPGQATPLTISTADKFSAWLAKTIKPAGPLLLFRIKTLADNPAPGAFFASRKQSPTIPTLNAIRWRTEPGMVAGQINP